MKKILLFYFFILFAVSSCSSDDSSNNIEITPNIEQNDWIFSKINLVNGISILYTDQYPHIVNCEKDFIRITNNNSAILFLHEEGTCELSEITQPWNRTGNQVSLKIYDIPISGTIILESNKEMIIESDASQFSYLIMILYPEYADMINLIEGMKIQLILVK